MTYGLTTARNGTYANKSYAIHPGVAAAGRSQAGKPFRDAADAELGAYWNTVAKYAREREGEDRTTGLVVHAGLAAAPYLMRQAEWSGAAFLLERAFQRDRSRSTATAVLPALQAIIATGQVPGAVGVLAKVLRVIDPAAAGHQVQAFMDAALIRGDYRSASAVAGDLIDQYRHRGLLAQALNLSYQKADYSQRAGLGPWTQLLDETRRLQVLNAMGKAEHVLAEVERLRTQMQTLPAVPEQPEITEPWHAREMLLDIGRDAARRLSCWNDALDLCAAVVASMQERGAPAGECARTRFNDYLPLLRLGRVENALALLRDCRQVFENAHDIQGIGKVLGALAEVEDERGHRDAAISLVQDALRYSYLAGNVIDIAYCYHALGNYLRPDRQPVGALATHLAGALIRALAGAEGVDRSVRSAAVDIREFGDNVTVPTNVTDLCSQAARVPGVDLHRLLRELAPEQDMLQQTLQELIVRCVGLAAAPSAVDPANLAPWEPVIAALLAANGGDTQAAETLDAELDSYEDSADWGMLAAGLRRLRTGETGPELLAGLDEIDTAIMTRAVDALSGKTNVPAVLWPAMPLGPLLGELVGGARGDQAAAGHARQDLEEMTRDPSLVPLAVALGTC